MSDRLDFIIKTKEDLIAAVHRGGFLPLFRNSLPGFSVEDHVDPSVLKRDGNYKKGGATGFDTSINRLQAQGYVLISNFVYFHEILPDVSDKSLRKFLR